MLCQSCHTRPKESPHGNAVRGCRRCFEAVSKYVCRKAWRSALLVPLRTKGSLWPSATRVLGASLLDPDAWLWLRAGTRSSSAEKHWAKQKHLLPSLKKAAMLIRQPSQRRLPLVSHPSLSATKNWKHLPVHLPPLPNRHMGKDHYHLLSTSASALFTLVPNRDVSKALARFLGPPQSRCAPF